MRTTVRLRLTLWHVGVLALLLGAFGWALLERTRADLLRSADRELGNRSESVRQTWYAFRQLESRYSLMPGLFARLPGSPGGELLGSVSPGATAIERYAYFRQPRLLTLRGRSLLPYPPHPRPWDLNGFREAVTGREVFTNAVISGEPLRVLSVPLLEGAEQVGVVQVARPIADLRQVEVHQLRTFLTLAPLGLLVVGIGGIFLTGRALSPVRRMTQEAARIEARDLSRRLPVTGDDELAEMAKTFNALIARLETAFAENATAYERLERLYEQQRRFAGDASHELRTPLTRLKAQTSLTLSRERTPEEYRAALQTADSAADTMRRVVDDLLLVARSDTGQLELRIHPVPVVELFESAVGSAARRPGGPSVQVIGNVRELSVQGDLVHLERLLVNLLENAIRHTPPEGTITLSASGDGEFVRLAVTDTGEGIAPEHLPHLTERFYRVDDARSRKQGGTGLGLSICAGIVKAHGGEMEITSSPGAGTSVAVRLPAARLPGRNSLDQSAVGSGAHSTPRGGPG